MRETMGSLLKGKTPLSREPNRRLIEIMNGKIGQVLAEI